jgi:hypothetical protein
MGESLNRCLADIRYGGIRSKHPTLAARAAIEAARRVSTATNRPTEQEEDEETDHHLGFAQKLLLGTFSSFDLD